MNRYVHLTLALGAVGLLALLLMLAVGAQPAARADGNVIKVPDDYATIQAAVDGAVDGDTILVAADIYRENLSITKGITLSGGWNISFTQRIPGDSTIDGGGLGRVISITCPSSDTVVTIDGFTIASGDATGQGGPPVALAGGDWLQGAGQPASPSPEARALAQRVADLRARLAHLVAQGLYPGGEAAYQATLARLDRLVAQAEQARVQPRPADTDDASLQPGDCGGGVYSWNTSLHLLNCAVEGNLASATGNGYGGGVFAGQAPPGGVRIVGNTMQDNIASGSNVPTSQGVGGGLYVWQAPGAVIVDNVISENAASSAGVAGVGVGGGLAVDASLSPVVRGNQIARNTAGAGWETLEGLGGGAYLRDVSGAVVTDNVFRENVGVLYGAGGSGGLILAASENVLVADNTATGNWGVVLQPDLTNVSGGAFSLHNVTAVTVTGNAVSNNVACLSGPRAGDSFGGGIDAQLFSDSSIISNTITGNVAIQTGVGWGGGVSFWAANDSMVADNTLADNVGSLSGGGGGGGIFLRNTEGCLVYHNRFQGNQGAGEGEGSGGGLRVEGDGPYSFDTTVDANLFLDNQACVQNPSVPSLGGACVIGTDGFTFTNNVVAGNTADQGSGLALEYATRGMVVNNTLAGNNDVGVLVDWPNRTPVTFTNNVIVSHTVGISVATGATATVRYTLWDGNGTDITGPGAISQTHPVTGNPGFVDPADYDYHLTFGSAATNAGDPAGVPPAPDHDADGVARPVGLTVDLGAYEWQGTWQHLPLVGKDYRAAIGWAAGDAVEGYGTIIHTTDGGATWERQGTTDEIPDAHLGGTFAIDAQNAWVVGAQATILRTRDGGRSWELQEVPAEVADAEFCGVYAADGNTAWTAGVMWAGGKTGVILHTTDGGHTWTKQAQDLALQSQLCGVYAPDAEHAWVVGDEEGGNQYGTIVRTRDGGTTWERMPYTLDREASGYYLISVHGIDADTVWAVGRDQVLHTADGGPTWMDQKSSGIFDINGVFAVDRNTVWVVVDNGGIYRSEDGGANWEPQAVPSGLGGDYVLRISAVDAQTAWAVTEPDPRFPTNPGHVLHTSDGGQTWVSQTLPVTPAFWGVSFVR